jgi:hypothetical protein
MLFPAWSGVNTVDRLNRGHRELLAALVDEVKRRAGRPVVPRCLRGLDLVGFGRKKAEPMVRGLFPRSEQGAVLDLVGRSLLFVTPRSIRSVLLGCERLDTAWTLANLYLGSAKAELLGKSAPELVGFSEELTCYVSPDYFRHEDPFADFVVHETAHIFHNCKRRTAGLPETRTREWLLDIDYRKRETFAYACEAYSRILERSYTPAGRRALAQEFHGFDVDDGRVNSAEVADLVREACGRRNGWKVILGHCAPTRPASAETLSSSSSRRAADLTDRGTIRGLAGGVRRPGDPALAPGVSRRR